VCTDVRASLLARRTARVRRHVQVSTGKGFLDRELLISANYCGLPNKLKRNSELANRPEDTTSQNSFLQRSLLSSCMDPTNRSWRRDQLRQLCCAGVVAAPFLLPET